MPIMSFALTTDQMRAGTKSVTRRNPATWKNLKPGDIVTACVKTQGLKKGEKVEKIGTLRIVSNTLEPLDAIYSQGYGRGRSETAREGFAGHSGKWFVEMFLERFGGQPDQVVRRIEFEHLKGAKS